MQNFRKFSGFSLIELMIGIAVLSIVAVVGIPSFSTWMQDTKTRTIAESLQNGVRLAQVEALNKGRRVVFFITDEVPSASAVASNVGGNWGVRSMKLTPANEVEEFIQGAVLDGQGGNVVVTASSAEIRFNSIGRLTNTASRVIYEIRNSKGSRRLNVVVSNSGSVRMCDPDRSITTAADGC
jgi:type IV fimbrial biogenesis protein FimT